MSYDISKIRNFSIIAHIDHGKSTLADRMLLLTGMVSERQFQDQFLDDLDIERERGITIKARAVRMNYTRPDGVYTLNLIDTPGHVDFSYEVSRSLQACEGALLLVDASQGVEAQTVANTHLALENNLTIIPVLNKIDLPHARPDEVAEEVEHALGLNALDCILASAKLGTGTDEILAAIIDRIGPPQGDAEAPLRALIFDAVYNDYRGVIAYVRVYDGRVSRGAKIKMLATGRRYEVEEVGTFCPGMTPVESLAAGEVGYVITGVRELREVRVGDTIAPAKSESITPLPGFREPQPMVYCGLYPSQNQGFEALRKALDRLSINDSSFTYEPETSTALGLGFRCGFLGMLHMEIVQERLERESGIELIQTAPNVTYEIELTNGDVIRVHSAADAPDAGRIKEWREPIVRARFLAPSEYVGTIMRLAEERRAEFVKQDYLSPTRVSLEYDVPLAEIVYDFFDTLKGSTRGYGTMDYELIGYFPANLVKVSILINGEPVDALSVIMHRSVSQARGRRMVQRLKKNIPRHMFQIPLQAAIGGKIIARETISPMKKDVTAKCYGGDVTRKRKLWEKQKEGKKRMKSIGQVAIPQEAFLAVLSIRDED